MPTITDLHAVIRPEISGKRTWNYMDAITRYHRIQFSPGFASAATHCRDLLADLGLDADIRTYTADGSTSYYNCTPPVCWRARAATLDIVNPDQPDKRLADFSVLPPSLISRSGATGPDGVVCDLVVVDTGDNDEQYAGLDVAGKIVLARGPVNLVYEHAVRRRGAAGIILEGLPDVPPVRKRPDLPDAINYWLIPFSIPEPSGFGFSISARAGLRLRSLAAENTVRLQAVVDAEFAPGQFEVVNAFIPGTTSEEVLLVAHLCHPQPSANDNASGSAALIETAAALQRLIDNGQLNRPRRGIRFLLVPEMTGTFAFLACEPDGYSRCVAALNLDMVGADQNLCGSSLLIEHPPRAVPSYTGQLLEAVMNQVLGYSTTPTGGTTYPDYRFNTVTFSGGSDHFVLSDPRINIPCPMIIQWPDRFYHTSFDTVDKVDPLALEFAAAASAIYCYYLAAADLPEATSLAHQLSTWLSSHLTTRTADVITKLQAMITGSSDAEQLYKLEHMAHAIIDLEADRTRQDLTALYRLTDDNDQLSSIITEVTTDITDQALLHQRRIDRLIATVRTTHNLQSVATDIKTSAELDRVIKLTHKGPIFIIPEPQDEEQRRQILQIQGQLRSKLSLLGPVLAYWLDGKRTLAAALDLTEAETGLRDDDIVLKYIDILISSGLAQIVE